MAQETTDLPASLPAAVVDLRTVEGAGLAGATWRYSDASVVEVEHREPGPDLRPSGAPNRTNDITPHAGAADFDDSGWQVIAPAELETRRSHGRLAFNWYRTSVTLPRKVADFDVTGSTVVFELVIDDYAEIWVDGKLPVVLGQTGGQLVKGFNAPNRVVLTSNAKPGQTFQIAVFGVNGPISNPPVNFIWIRSATLDFYRKGKVGGASDAGGAIVRLDPAFDRIVPKDARIEKLAGGFQFTEGPVWHPDGYLLFSDPNANTIYRWSREGAVSVYRSKSGYSGFDIGAYRQPGSNGLTLDRNGLLTINEHGNRRVTRLERPGNITVLADRYQGKRLNSPNDLVYRADGSLYFTDPPFGLPKAFDDPKKELPFSGVYRLRDGEADAAHHGAERAERHRVLAGRALPVRGQLGSRRGRCSCATRCRRDGTHGERARVLRFHQRAGGGRARWGQGGPARATSTSPRRAGCGSCPPRARRSGGSSRRSTTRTSPGATTTRGGCT